MSQERVAEVLDPWQRWTLLLTAAVSVVALYAVDPLHLGGPDRSALLWVGRAILAVAGAWAAVAALRRAGPVTAGIVAVVAGTIATGAGVGYTGMHIVKVGLTNTPLLGVAGLVASMALLIVGAVILFRRTRGWWKLVAIPAAAAVFFYGIAPLTVAVYVTHVPPQPPTTLTPASKGLPYETVSMRTRDGISLAGWYVPSRNRVGVIVLHGSGSTRSHMLDHLTVLARQGFGVLAVDARGHGESGGTAMDYGWAGVPDVEAAASWLSERAEIDDGRIGVYGMSMGGVEALTAAAGDARIRAVVTEGAGISSLADTRSMGLGAVLRFPYDLVRLGVADLLTPAEPLPPLADSIGRIAPRRVMLIAGRGASEQRFTALLAAAAPGSAEVWSLPQTPHAHALWDHREEWARRVGGFLRAALLAG